MIPHRPPRTRHQWDNFWLHTVKSEPKRTSSSDGSKTETGCVHISDSSSSASMEDFGMHPKGSVGISGKKRGGFQNTRECSGSKPRVTKRSKKTYVKVDYVVEVKEPIRRTGKKKKMQKRGIKDSKFKDVKLENESGVSRNHDVIYLTDEDVEVEEVFSNGSNLKVVSGSVSGSLSKNEAKRFVPQQDLRNSSSAEAQCSRDFDYASEESDGVKADNTTQFCEVSDGVKADNTTHFCEVSNGVKVENDAHFCEVSDGVEVENATHLSEESDGDNAECSRGVKHFSEEELNKLVVVDSTEEEDHMSDEDFEVEGPVSIDSESSESDSSSKEEDEEEEDDDNDALDCAFYDDEDDLGKRRVNSSHDPKEKTTPNVERKHQHSGEENEEDAIEEGGAWKRKTSTHKKAGEIFSKCDHGGDLDTRRVNFPHDSKGKKPLHAHKKPRCGSNEDVNIEENIDDHYVSNVQENAATMDEDVGKSSSYREETGGSWKRKTRTHEKGGESLKKCDVEGDLHTRRTIFSHDSNRKRSRHVQKKRRNSDDHGRRNVQENAANLAEEMGKSSCSRNEKGQSGKPDNDRDFAAYRMPDLGRGRTQGQAESSGGQGGVSVEEPQNKSNYWFKNSNVAKNLDMAKILLESIYSTKERPHQPSDVPLDVEETKWKFWFEDEVEKPPEKSEWDKQIDSLFREMELCLRLDEPDSDETSFSETEVDDQEPSEVDESPAACCSRGDHQLFFDEQIGLLCRYCSVIVLDVKHGMPPFYKPPSYAKNRNLDTDESPTSILDDINYQGLGNEAPNSASHATGTVWDLIHGVKGDMYPHQREGFEFMWKNVAGDTRLENLKQLLSSGGRGCIISHAPGTGKTRLSIVFIHSFLKLYPDCRPVIIAPPGMLLTWESEFKKWNVDIPFHNMNSGELSGNENAVASNLASQVGSCKMDKDCIRLLKLFSWINSPSVLGIGYQLFERLVEDGQEQLSEHIRTVLLEYPGLLVLDEGHTPRNDQSQMYNAFTKVKTHRRIILSGTPFQNNFVELYNTLRLVNPMFEIDVEGQFRKATSARKRKAAKRNWVDLTNSIGKSPECLKKFKETLHSFVHVHKGSILEESLPGLRRAIVFLVPTDRQKMMLEKAVNIGCMFECTRHVSMISLHPSLVMRSPVFSSEKDELEKLESDKNAGVKLIFVRELIRLADALGERVLVFSQYIDPLLFIKKHLESSFSWKEGKEILYMDGKVDRKLRQRSISSFNSDASEARVLLASQKACCEGINLVGASRVVLLDTVWNPSVEKQAISRAYRLGQKKIVYVYRLFTSGIEERQFKRQMHKERMSELIFSSLDGQHGNNEKPQVTWEDQVLDSMRDLDRDGVRHIIEKVVHQERESDYIQNLGLNDV